MLANFCCSPRTLRRKASWSISSMGPYKWVISTFGAKKTAKKRVNIPYHRYTNNISTEAKKIILTWNLRQWNLLWPLYIILWCFTGHAMGLAVSLMKPQQLFHGAPHLPLLLKKLQYQAMQDSVLPANAWIIGTHRQDPSERTVERNAMA